MEQKNNLKQYTSNKTIILPIKLSDLVNELCKLTNSNINSLNIYLTTNTLLSQIPYNKPEDLTIENIQNNIKQNLQIVIEDKNLYNRNPLKINLLFPLNLNDKMANGEPIFNNLELISVDQDFEIIIGKNIGEYICTFTLDDMFTQDKLLSEPDGVLKTAIINCYKSKKIYSEQNTTFTEQEKL